MSTVNISILRFNFRCFQAPYSQIMGYHAWGGVINHRRSIPRNLILALLLACVALSNAATSFAAESSRRGGALRTAGDYIQVINPVLSSIIASQEDGLGHFLIIYAQSTVITHGMKLVGQSGKLKLSKRPHIENKKDRYNGMPSGHTNSAWVAASYTRTFSQDYRYLSIPMYIGAVVTGYSRIKSREHTTLQVVSGAALAELVTYINSRMDWSNNYRSVNFNASPAGGGISLNFKF